MLRATRARVCSRVNPAVPSRYGKRTRVSFSAWAMAGASSISRSAMAIALAIMRVS
ncbi:hypothetical protein FQZ97_1224250 [compost metagenome]